MGYVPSLSPPYENLLKLVTTCEHKYSVIWNPLVSMFHSDKYAKRKNESIDYCDARPARNHNASTSINMVLYKYDRCVMKNDIPSMI